MKEEQINQAIKDYLLIAQTSYALMINGKWGCGKTYYWNNTISPELISKTVSINDAKKEIFYKPIYISLYGIENIEEISKRIFLELIPKTGESKAAGILSTIGSKMVSVASNFFNLGDLSLNIEEIKNIYDLKNAVITFDDIERIGGDENLLEKILGFLNYLSEHDGIKIILLTNENELKKRFNDNWLKTKEKIINQSVPFNISYDSIIENLINSFSEFPNYNDFLKENISVVKKAFYKSETSNLRTLKYSIERFFKLFTLFEIDNELDFIKKHGEHILYYTLVISFEHKKGDIDIDDKYEISSLDVNSFSQMDLIRHLSQSSLNETKKESGPEEKLSKEQLFLKEKESYQREFHDKYFNENEHIIGNKELFEFIITGLYETTLIAFLKNIYIPQVNEIAPQVKLLDELFSYSVNGLSQKELNKGIKKVIKVVKKGEYHIMHYPIIYDLFYQLDERNLLYGYSMNEVKSILLKGIQKANKFDIYKDKVLFVEEHWGEKTPRDYDLRKKYKELAELNETKRLKKEATSFMKDLIESPEKSFDFLYNHNGINNVAPLFSFLPVTKLVKTITQLSNKELIEFNKRINSRFRPVSSTVINLEKEAFENIIAKFQKYFESRKSCDIKQFHLKNTVKLFEKYLAIVK